MNDGWLRNAFTSSLVNKLQMRAYMNIMPITQPRFEFDRILRICKPFSRFFFDWLSLPHHNSLHKKSPDFF